MQAERLAHERPDRQRARFCLGAVWEAALGWLWIAENPSGRRWSRSSRRSGQLSGARDRYSFISKTPSRPTTPALPRCSPISWQMPSPMAGPNGHLRRQCHCRRRTSNSRSNAGNPIPDAAMERLFQPFYRGKPKGRQQGLGLGLYISSQIARAHGGRLDVSSDNGRTSFTFRMPAS